MSNYTEEKNELERLRDAFEKTMEGEAITDTHGSRWFMIREDYYIHVDIIGNESLVIEHSSVPSQPSEDGDNFYPSDYTNADALFSAMRMEIKE